MRFFNHRQLCLLLHAENIFHSMADILLKEEDLKFASTMVQTLNTILLTSAELFQLRNQLKDLRTQVMWGLPARMPHHTHPSKPYFLRFPLEEFPHLLVFFRKAVLCSVASIALGVTIQWPLFRSASWRRIIITPMTSSRNCILCSNMMSDFLMEWVLEWVKTKTPWHKRISGDLEVTVDFLMEVDKLVQLIESPIFTCESSSSTSHVEYHQHLSTLTASLLFQTSVFSCWM